ncbi:MAG: RidA family protein [Planctomycetes bacterium]|nr:RidA family protein [Planctomycetota bacterium]
MSLRFVVRSSALALLVLCGCAGTASRSALPGKAAFLSEAILTDRLVFLSGQLGTDPTTGQLVGPDLASQTRAALDHLARAAERAGVSLADAARVEVYLTDMNDYAEMNALYAERFPEPAPARTCIGVAALPRGGRIEIAATIVRR